MMQHLAKDGFTIDAFIGYGLGYRNVSIRSAFQQEFRSISTIISPKRFGSDLTWAIPSH